MTATLICDMRKLSFGVMIARRTRRSQKNTGAAGPCWNKRGFNEFNIVRWTLSPVLGRMAVQLLGGAFSTSIGAPLDPAKAQCAKAGVHAGGPPPLLSRRRS